MTKKKIMVVFLTIIVILTAAVLPVMTGCAEPTPAPAPPPAPTPTPKPAPPPAERNSILVLPIGTRGTGAQANHRCKRIIWSNFPVFPIEDVNKNRSHELISSPDFHVDLLGERNVYWATTLEDFHALRSVSKEQGLLVGRNLVIR